MRKALLAMAAIIAAVWAVFAIDYPTIHVRYRVVIDVEHNGAVRTGSSVLQDDYVTWTKVLPGDTNSGGIGRTTYGYVPTVDLESAGLVFVTDERSDSPHSIPLGALPLNFFGSKAVSYEASLAHLPKVTDFKDVPPESMPRLLHYRDINDESTFHGVDPFDLARTLGPGIRLLRLRVQMTQDPITPKPAGWPAWWKVNPG